MSKIILLNGGKGCGKTDLTEYLKSLYPEMRDRRCKDHLHELTMKLFCVPEELYWRIYNNRSLKETANTNFMLRGEEVWRLDKVLKREPSVKFPNEMYPLSQREAMIYVSEVVCKPAFGKEYFGEARVKAMRGDALSIDDSTGFVEELNPLIRKIGQENILLIRIKGRGDFEGDSRDFIPDGVIEDTEDVWNTKDIMSYFAYCKDIVERFLEGS
jgi:hypothetical protein